MIKFFLLFFITLILLIQSVCGWGVHTHNKMAQEILSEGSTNIGKLCSSNDNNKQAYLLGAVTPDLTVIYYFEEGGKEYRLSHNWNFQQELMSQAITDDERCFAWGVAAHLIQDGISHTEVVPSAIKTFNVPNWLLHPLLEKKYDSALVSKYTWLKTSTPHMMDALDGAKADRYIEMIDYAIGENSNIDIKSELIKLRFALDEFYETQFRPSGDVWIFKTYPYIDKLTNSFAPIIGTMNFGDIEYYYKKSKEQTISVFNNWGSRYQISPHGFDELKKADDSTSVFFYLILIGIIIIPFGIAYFKRKPIYLFLLPILLIILIAYVYANL